MNTSVRKGLLGAAALFLGMTMVMPGAASAATKAKAVSHKAAAHRVVGNAHVKAIQEALDKAGAKLKVDGLMGKKTEGALRAYQKKHGLKVTGTADKATLKSLGVK